MIRIFESDDEKPANNASAEAPFALNIASEDTPVSPEPPVGNPVPEEPSPVEAPPPPPENSPWEKIEEGPVNIAEELFAEPESLTEAEPESAPDTMPAEAGPAPDVIPVEPETPAATPEPVLIEDEKPAGPEIFTKLPYTPQTTDETIRTTGLAWNAGIIFFGSVVFMMILGWGADLLLGTSPWGLVGGIVFGSIIGFVQFVRISSRIFRK